VKMENKEETILLLTAFAACITFHSTLVLFALIMHFTWKDSRWPAFDSDDYDKKMMNGPLKPWQKGN